MTKKKKQEETPKEIKPFEIIGATLNDDICNYSFEVMTGATAGEKHSVKGKNIIHNDFREAFRTLNRHLASIDGAFKNEEHSNIDQMENNIITSLFDVRGFRISGNAENETITLQGTKYSNEVSGRLSVETSKIALDSLSAYKWYNELKDAADLIRKEAELYMQGKCAPMEDAEVEVKSKKQTKMFVADEDFDKELKAAEL